MSGKSLDELLRDLASPDWNVRRVAAEALGELGDGRALESLLYVLRHDKSWWVRSAAAEALVRIGARAGRADLVLEAAAADIEATLKGIGMAVEKGGVLPEVARKLLLLLRHYPVVCNAPHTRQKIDALITELANTYEREVF